MTKLAIEREFESLIKAKKNWIEGFAARYLRSAEEIEEVVQDVRLKIWRNLKRLPANEYSLQKWLRVVTIRTACDYSRARRRRQSAIDYSIEIDSAGSCRLMGQELTVPAIVSEDTTGAYDPFVEMDLVKFFDGLTVSHKEVLRLWLEGFSYEEIAKVTASPVGTVRSRLHYARKKALKSLKHHL
jgi:RNA polymerase sigma-70 factor (ECF subfamily)